MKKTIALAALSLCAGAAYASPPTLIAGFQPAGPGEVESPCADGLSILDYNERTGYSSFYLLMVGLKPNTTYGVQVNSAVVPESPNSTFGFTSPLAFTTGPWGIGTYNLQLPSDVTNDPLVFIFIWDQAMMIDPITGDLIPDFDAMEYVSDEEIRAVGAPLW